MIVSNTESKVSQDQAEPKTIFQGYPTPAKNIYYLQ